MSTPAVISNPRSLALAGPVGSLDAYLQAIHAIPILGPAEEQALARRLRDNEDLDAARDLVLSHLRFVVHIARGYMGYGLQLGDLVQEGNIGLMKAVKRFDPDVGVRLVSFAVHWIRAEIHEFVLRNWRLVRVATTKAQRKLFFNLRRAKPHLGWLTREETAAIASDLGVPAHEVTEMEQRLSGHDVAFDPLPSAEEEHSHSPALYLTAADADPAQALEADDWQEQAAEKLKGAVEQLDPRSRDIIQSRWGTEQKATLHELADRFGISAERVRQIEQQALKTLRGAVLAS